MGCAATRLPLLILSNSHSVLSVTVPPEREILGIQTMEFRHYSFRIFPLLLGGGDILTAGGVFDLTLDVPGGVQTIKGLKIPAGVTATQLAGVLENFKSLAPIIDAKGINPPIRNIKVAPFPGVAGKFFARFDGALAQQSIPNVMVATVAPGQGAFTIATSLIWGTGISADEKRVGNNVFDQARPGDANALQADFDNGVVNVMGNNVPVADEAQLAS